MSRRTKDEYRKALGVLKDWARADGAHGWTDKEWRRLLVRAAAQKAEFPKQTPRFSLSPIISAAAALLVLVWGSLYLLKNNSGDSVPPGKRNVSAVAELRPLAPGRRYVRPGFAAPAASRPLALLAAARRESKPREDKPAFTWISQETGLKIVWFTNDNLKLEDEQ